MNILLLPILIPLVTGAAVLASNRVRGLKEALALIGTLANLAVAVILFNKEISFAAPWAGLGLEFILRCYSFNSFVILAAGFFLFLVTLYSAVFLRDKKFAYQFYLYLLLTLAFVNGAALSDNLILMLFFWEGTLLAMFGMIAIGNRSAFRTATKAFVILGIADLCMMAGIVISGNIAGTFTISRMSVSPAGLGAVAFVLFMTGAIAKGGSMPFHSWIPDAALDAPLPFMAVVPASLEKLLGIYLLTRICLDIFTLTADSWISTMLMTVGVVTIILAVMMALIQKDYKRLLSYHAISQMGYMILGIGTLVPAGIIGGLFHMLNNALYKCCLFLTGGSVERQTGTTDLEKLGGIGNKMPVTFACFLITAAAISGVPPFNGFISKELIYDAAIERGKIFYLAALAGSFLTAASFLKLGHAAFLGRRNKEHDSVKEVPAAMLFPMIIIAGLCVLFGTWSALPINAFFRPVLGADPTAGHEFGGFPKNMTLVSLSVITLIAALMNHIYGVKRTGKGVKAADHIHYAPGLSFIYDKAEKRWFDPYDIGLKMVKVVSETAWLADRAIDWVYNVLTVKVIYAFTYLIRRLHNGSHKVYIAWSVLAAFVVILFLIR